MIITAPRDRATTIIRRARPALDALTDEPVAHEMAGSRRHDEILVQAGYAPAEAAASGGPALVTDSSTVPPPASPTGSGPSGPTGT